jgi:hypothetical protein
MKEHRLRQVTADHVHLLVLARREIAASMRQIAGRTGQGFNRQFRGRDGQPERENAPRRGAECERF